MIRPNGEKSLIIIKPDAVQRNLVGAIIARFESKGLRIIGVKMMEERKKQQAKKEAKLLAELNSVIAVLNNGALKIGAKTGTSGKIFGSVTTVQIARAIKEQKGYEIDRRRISILDEVKELGTYKAKIDFGNGNEIEVEMEIVSE